jgi:RNA recognition motif-containing protein
LGRKLYCGNLGYDVSALDLEKLFGQYGQVRDAQVVSDRDTGQSKGFAFIEMNSDSEATAAINALNGTMQNGRPLTVNEAKPRESRGGGGGGGGGRTFGGNRGGRY